MYNFIQNKMIDRICEALLAFLVGVIGYLSPIRNIYHIMVAVIIIDFIVGVITARIKRGEGIDPEKAWTTVLKLFFSVILVTLLYIMDKEMSFAGIVTHRLTAWVITIFEVWSISKNFGLLSNHRIFRIINKLATEKIKRQTGVNLEKETKA